MVQPPTTPFPELCAIRFCLPVVPTTQAVKTELNQESNSIQNVEGSREGEMGNIDCEDMVSTCIVVEKINNLNKSRSASGELLENLNGTQEDSGGSNVKQNNMMDGD